MSTAPPQQRAQHSQAAQQAQAAHEEQPPQQLVYDEPRATPNGLPKGKEAFIFEGNSLNINQLVTKAKLPVILYFYADWAEPCKELTPVLERMVTLNDGDLRLVKINADTFPEMLKATNTQHVPTMIAFYEGKMLDLLSGVPTEADLEKMVLTCLKAAGATGIKPLIKTAERALEQGDIPAATQIYNDILSNKHLKSEAVALGGLAMCAIAEGNVDIAKQLADTIGQIYPSDVENPLVKRALSAVELSLSVKTGGGSIKDLEAKILQNPNDSQARYDLAVALFTSNQPEKAIKSAIEIIKRDKMFNDDAPRKLLLKIFEALGADNPIAIDGRKKFSSAWFL